MLRYILILYVPLILFSQNSLAEDDIYFLTEHLAEAAQDSRYFAQPWPDSDASGWHPVVAASFASASSDLEKIQGQLLSAGVMLGGYGRWQYLVMLFYDQFDVYAVNGIKQFTPGGLRNIPLDLPATAEFSAAGGKIKHYGVSFSAKRIFAENKTGGRRWSYLVGLFYETLSLEDYRIQYRLLSGTNAGASGTIDNSGRNTFATPYLGLLFEQSLTNKYVLGARIAFGQPLPEGNYSTRVTGPGFSVSTDDQNNVPGVIGDPYIMIGMDLRNRDNNFRIDFGSLLLFPVIEKLSHPGVNAGWMISLSWEIE